MTNKSIWHDYSKGSLKANVEVLVKIKNDAYIVTRTSYRDHEGAVYILMDSNIPESLRHGIVKYAYMSDLDKD